MNIITKIEMIDAPQPIVEISPKGESSIYLLEFKPSTSIGVELYWFVGLEIKKVKYYDQSRSWTNSSSKNRSLVGIELQK